MGTELPDVSKSDIYGRLLATYNKSTGKMLYDLGATEISVDEVKPSQVFSAYSGETGFFSGEGKKHQFPDAFIFERLKKAP